MGKLKSQILSIQRLKQLMNVAYVHVLVLDQEEDKFIKLKPEVVFEDDNQNLNIAT